jgi:membrane-bound ClpP family serine protease
MEISDSLIPWFFAAVMAIGVGYLLLSLIFGEVAEAGGGLLESLDGALEGVGVDIFPEALEGQDGKGVGCGIIAAFLAGFGVVGLVADLQGAHLLVSIGLATAAGALFGGVFFAGMTFLVKQEVSGTLRTADLEGLTARVTIQTPPGKTGEAFVVVKNQRRRYPIREINNQALERDDLVKVVSSEGVYLYVEKL